MAPWQEPRELPDEIHDILKEWASRRVMKFRWPADFTDAIAQDAATWGGIGAQSSAPVQKATGRLKDTAEDGKQGYGVKTLQKTNEGPAVDSCLDFWRKFPGRNIADIQNSVKKIGPAFGVVAAAIDAYRAIAYTRLCALQRDLSENEAWAWLVSDWFFSDKNAKIDQRARAMVAEFDQKMKKTYDSLVADNFTDFRKLMDRLAEQYSKMIAGEKTSRDMDEFVRAVDK
ncbi:hypothetical protein OG417_07600 [Actinoallomurus sp. NBC_01490]|uniref:hypothetical protein n=1 Tax=Actinoallomurus sp. NBC_01490 TaxID=2903557 RepID=UPI002E3637AF|nr:hypothetical protein [Actinoallomurus sp. NBC_01490]